MISSIQPLDLGDQKHKAIDHHSVTLITNSSADDRVFFTRLFFVLKDCARPFLIARLFEADRLSIGYSYIASVRSRPGPWSAEGPRPPTDVPKLWASNDRRYASFQRHVAYIKIVEAFVKEWAASGAGSAAPLEPPSPRRSSCTPTHVQYMTVIAQFSRLQGFAKQTISTTTMHRITRVSCYILQSEHQAPHLKHHFFDLFQVYKV